MHYVVTNARDYDPAFPATSVPIPGTLRYGIEMIAKCKEIGVCAADVDTQPVWISSGIPLSTPIKIFERWNNQLEKLYSLPLLIPSNVTIEGPIGIDAKYGAMRVSDASNVVLRNIRFGRIAGATNNDGQLCYDNEVPGSVYAQHSGCGVPLLVDSRLQAIERIWVDHNEFKNCGEECFDIWVSGPLPATGRLPPTDKITVSNNSFKDSFYALPLGELGAAENNRRPLLGTMRISVYGNLFQNIYRRSPRVAGAFQVHFFNNAVLNWTDLANGKCAYGRGSDVAGGGQLLAENNYYVAPTSNDQLCKHAVENEVVWGLYGSIRQTGNIFQNGGVCVKAMTSTTFVPCTQETVFTPSYPHTLLTAGQARTSVLANAGVQSGSSASAEDTSNLASASSPGIVERFLTWLTNLLKHLLSYI